MMANNDKKRFPANQPIVQLTITGPELVVGAHIYALVIA